jgi:hypothetical protein
MVHICPLCSKEFPTESEYFDHVSELHTKYAAKNWKKCPICKTNVRFFPTVVNVDEHLKKTHPNASHKCPLCTEKFQAKEELIDHFETQHPTYDCSTLRLSQAKKLVKKFACSQCDYNRYVVF